MLNKGCCNQGFTLIELLVVVLIIGILAAVALPQYQKAVYKSRYAIMRPAARSLAAAQELYYLENGSYANRFSDLAIDVPSGNTTHSTGETQDIYRYPWGTCQISLGASEQVVFCENTKINMRIQIYYQHSPALPGVSLCAATGVSSELSSIQNQICKAETKQANYYSHNEGHYTTWKY